MLTAESSEQVMESAVDQQIRTAMYVEIQQSSVADPADQQL